MSYPQQIILPHYTYQDYIHWEGRWELIEGHPIAMSPAPGPKHQKILGKLYTAFSEALRAGNCKKCEAYFSPLDYKVAEDTILQPDLFIVCKEITGKYLDFAPGLVLEILSPSTALKDRHTKFGIYESQGVKYYLIADPDKSSVEIFQLEDKTYSQQQLNISEPVQFIFNAGECEATILLNDIFS